MEPGEAARWHRVREAFDEVADLAPAERATRLAALYGDDHALHREVESLITHDRSDVDPIGAAVATAARGAAAAAITGAGHQLLHYRLTTPIGQGGMGVVWKAIDQTLGRDVAIKVLPPGVGDDPRRRARFEREAKLLASLNHTNIAAIFGLHELNRVHFLAMEYVPGDDLAARLRRGRIPLAEALRIARQIAEALEEAHEKGVVHRDLKPANVKVTAEGRVKVLDFGLAKAFAPDSGVHGDSETSSHDAPTVESTREGVVLGTAAYMPPEQARGASVDKRADIWAFGVLLFEMLSGVRPFAGETAVDLLAAIISIEPEWSRLPSDTPAGVVALIRRCIQKDVRQRLRDIGEARIALEQAIDASAAASPASAPAAPWIRRWGIRAAAAAAVLALGSGAFWLGRQTSSPAAPAAAPTIAVLPLVDLGRQGADDYFADGLTVELLGRLARNPRLRVTAQTSAFRFREAGQDPRAIGRALGVSTLLEGSVRRFGSRVRLTVQLVNTDDGFHLWSDSYDRELGDLLSVQDEIAQSVAQALHVALLGPAAAAAARQPSGPAYNAYLQGHYFRGRNTKDSLERAVGFFEEAIRLDAAFAPAWAGLSRTRSALGFEGFAPPGIIVGEARRAAERAIALDPAIADGHHALATVQRAFEWDWAGADASTRRALELEPNNADIVFGAARMASVLGRVDEALALTERAAALDPLNAQVVYRLGRYQQFLGRNDDAERSLTRALELAPEYPAARASLAIVLLAQSRVDAALAELARERLEYWRLHGEAVIYQSLGRRAEADAALQALIARHADIGGLQVAQLHAQRGDASEAVAWLERAYDSRDAGVSQVKATTYFERIAADPRYLAFLDKMRLPR